MLLFHLVLVFFSIDSKTRYRRRRRSSHICFFFFFSSLNLYLGSAFFSIYVSIFLSVTLLQFRKAKKKKKKKPEILETSSTTPHAILSLSLPKILSQNQNIYKWNNPKSLASTEDYIYIYRRYVIISGVINIGYI